MTTWFRTTQGIDQRVVADRDCTLALANFGDELTAAASPSFPIWQLYFLPGLPDSRLVGELSASGYRYLVIDRRTVRGACPRSACTLCPTNPTPPCAPPPCRRLPSTSTTLCPGSPRSTRATTSRSTVSTSPSSRPARRCLPSRRPLPTNRREARERRRPPWRSCHHRRACLRGSVVALGLGSLLRSRAGRVCAFGLRADSRDLRAGRHRLSHRRSASGYVIVLSAFRPARHFDWVPTLSLAVLLSLAFYPLAGLLLAAVSIAPSAESVVGAVDVWSWPPSS